LAFFKFELKLGFRHYLYYGKQSMEGSVSGQAIANSGKAVSQHVWKEQPP